MSRLTHGVAVYVLAAAAPIREERFYPMERHNGHPTSPKSAPRKLGMKGRFK